MERYFSKAEKASGSANLKPPDKRPKYHPYARQSLPTEENDTNRCGAQPSKRNINFKELNRALIRNLGDAANPITHSDAEDRADRAVSVSTGHQVSEEPLNRTLYLRDRESKLKAQHNPSNNPNGILRSVRIYISGYLEGTTDIEMRRIVTEAGGQTVLAASQCTHIVTSQWLSGSKTHRLLTVKMRRKPYVVRPEWVFESIAAGKRKPERNYAVLIANGHKPFKV